MTTKSKNSQIVQADSFDTTDLNAYINPNLPDGGQEVKAVKASKPSKKQIIDPYTGKPIAKATYNPYEEGLGNAAHTTRYNKGVDVASYKKYGVNLYAGMSWDKVRAENQSGWEQAWIGTKNLIPNVALGIVENVGYLAELFDGSQDYTNELTQWANRNRNPLGGEMYRENPNETWDMGDSAWWLTHGFGLVESIGEFAVTGMGVGALAKGGASLLANSIKASASVAKGINAGAQVLTASSLAYTEGAMSGAQVYKDVRAEYLSKNPEDYKGAETAAAEAASTTVRLNTVINTMLNITALSPFFKKAKHLRNADDLGMGKLVGETTEVYAKRLAGMKAPTPARFASLKKLGLESLQEGLEEDVNLFAEQEGRIKGGLVDEEVADSKFGRFFDAAFSSEGALNFALGAIGGAGQTMVTSYAPTQKIDETKGYGMSNLESAQSAENKMEVDRFMDYKESLKTDLTDIIDLQKELSEASKKGDKPGVEMAKRKLFNISARQAIARGSSDALAASFEEIALIDNSIVGEDGKTEAMRRGLAEDSNDTHYVEQAQKATDDLNMLREIYENTHTRYNYGDEKTANLASTVYELEVQNYQVGKVLTDLEEEITKLKTNLSSPRTNTELLPDDLLDAQMQLDAKQEAITDLKEQRKDLEASLKSEKRRNRIAKEMGVNSAEEVLAKFDERIQTAIDNLIESSEQVEKHLDFEGYKKKVAEFKDGKKKKKFLNKDGEIDNAKVLKQLVEDAKSNFHNKESYQEALKAKAMLESKQKMTMKSLDNIKSRKGRKAFVDASLKAIADDAKVAKEIRDEQKAESRKTDEVQAERKKKVEKKKKVERKKSLNAAINARTTPNPSTGSFGGADARASEKVDPNKVNEQDEAAAGEMFTQDASDPVTEALYWWHTINDEQRIQHLDGKDYQTLVAASERGELQAKEKTFKGVKFLTFLPKQEKKVVGTPTAPVVDSSPAEITEDQLDDATESLDQDAKGNEDEQGFYNVGGEVQSDHEGRIVSAHSAIAWLAMDYTTDELGVMSNAGNSLNPNMQEPLLHSHEKYQEGEVLSIRPVGDDPLVEDLNEKSIGVYNKDGKLVGHIHTLSYMREERVSNSDGKNLANNRTEIKALRKEVAEKGQVEVKISGKTYGHLSRFIPAEGQSNLRTLTQAFLDPELEFLIQKTDGLYNAQDQYMNDMLINKSELSPGTLTVLVPTPVEGKFAALPVITGEIGEDFADVILSGFDAYVKKDAAKLEQFKTATGIDISTEEGINTFITKYLHISKGDNSLVEAAANSEADSKRFINVKENRILFYENGKVIIDKKGKANANSYNPNKENAGAMRESLVKFLAGMRHNIRLKDMQHGVKFSMPMRAENGDIVANPNAQTYNDYIKENTYTNLNAFVVDHGDFEEHVYFVQPTIHFEQVESKEDAPVGSDSFVEAFQVVNPVEGTLVLDGGKGDLEVDGYTSYNSNYSSKQDAVAVANGWFIVSDGMGSYKQSGPFAQELSERLTNESVADPTLIESIVAEISEKYSDAAATLSLVKKNPDGSFTYYSIGDSPIYVVSKTGKRKLTIGESASTATNGFVAFTKQKGISDKTQVATGKITLKAGESIIIGSDALGDVVQIASKSKTNTDGLKEVAQAFVSKLDSKTTVEDLLKLVNKGSKNPMSKENLEKLILYTTAKDLNLLKKYLSKAPQLIESVYSTVKGDDFSSIIIDSSYKLPTTPQDSQEGDSGQDTVVQFDMGSVLFPAEDEDLDGMSFDPLALTGEAKDELRESVRYYLVDGYSAVKQQEVIDVVNTLVINTLNEAGEYKTSAEDLYAGAKSWFEKRAKKYAAVDKIAKRYQDVLDNWEEFVVISLRDISTNLDGVLKVSSMDLEAVKKSADLMRLYKENEALAEESGEELDQDNPFDQLFFEDKFAFKLDPKNTLSYHMKLFYSFIPDTKATHLTEFDAETKKAVGLTRLIPFDKVVEFINQSLSGVNPDFDLMITKLQPFTTSESTAWVDALIKRLNNAPEHIKNEFVKHASKHYANQKMVLVNAFPVKDQETGQIAYVNGNMLMDYQMKVIDVDRSKLSSIIQNQWQNNLMTQTDGLITVNADGTGTELSLDRAKELHQEFEKIAENPTHEDVSSWLEKIGVELSASDLKFIEATSKKYFKKKRYSLKGMMEGKGPLKVIADRLVSVKGDTEDAMYKHNPLVDNYAIRSLAAAAADLSEDLQSNSFRNGNGDTVYAYSMNKYLTHRVKDLKENPDQANSLADKLSKFSFSKVDVKRSRTGAPLVNSFNSSWLAQLISDGDFRETLSISYLDSLKEQGSTMGGKELTQQSANEHEVTKLALFQNGGQTKGADNRSVAHFMMPTLSDKSTMPLLQSLTHKIDISFDENDTLQVGPKTVNELYRIASAEYDRIFRYQTDASTREAADKISGYAEGAELFYQFPILNTVEGVFDTTGALVSKEVFERKAKAALKDHAETLIEGKIEAWKKADIVVGTDKNIQVLRYFDRDYLKNIPKTFNTKKKRAYYAAMDMEMNYIIANANVFMTIVGDPAQFYKSKSSDAIQRVKDTFENIGKRLAGDIAPGQDLPNSFGQKYNQLFLADLELASTEIDSIKAQFPQYAKFYEAIEATDAQEVVTVMEHVEQLLKEGKLTRKEVQAIKSALYKNEDINEALTAKVLQVSKPVYVEQRLEQDADLARKIYLKTSSFPLLPQFTKGMELDKLRLLMEDKKNNIARAVYKSGAKLGAPVALLDIWKRDEDGNQTSEIREDISSEEIKAATLELDRKGLRIQQEVPFKDKRYNTKGSQETKLLFVNLLEDTFNHNGESIKGSALRDVYYEIHHEIYKKGLKKLADKIGAKISIEGTDISGYDIEKLVNYLKEEAVTRGWSVNDMEYLALDKSDPANPKLKIPMWANASALKIESLLLSIISSNVTRQKFPGFSGPLGSNAGIRALQTLDNLSDTQLNDIVKVNGWDGSELRAMRSEDGQVKPDQILVPWKFAGKLEDYTEIKDGKKVLNMDKIPAELLKVFGFRIPTQGHNSMSYAEIVGFLPYSMGDLIITPRDFVTRMGSDFDIDKLYLYSYAHGLDKKSKEISIHRDQTDFAGMGMGSLQNQIMDIHHTVLSNESTLGHILEPLSFGELKKEDAKGEEIGLAYKIEQAYTRKEAASGEFSPLGTEYQKAKFLNARSGKTGIGVFSVDSVFNSMIQGTTVRLARLVKDGDKYIEVPMYITFALGTGENKKVIGDKVGQNYLGTSKSFTNKSYKSQIIAAFQSASVDNEKEAILEKLNINSVTFGVYGMLSQYGYDERFSAYLVNQPIVREFAALVEAKKDDITIGFTRDAKIEAFEELFDKYAELSTLEDFSLAKAKLDELSLEEMIEMVESDSAFNSESQYALRQVQALEKFMEIDSYAEEMQLVKSALNTDSKHLPKNLFEAVEKIQKVDNLRQTGGTATLKGVNALLGKGIYADATQMGLYPAKIFEGLFPYRADAVASVFNRIESISDYGRDKTLTADHKRQVFSDIRSYIFSNAEAIFSDSSIAKERERLLIDRYKVEVKGDSKIFKRTHKSLATELVELQRTPYGKSNPFIRTLQTQIDMQGKGISTISYVADKAQKSNELNMYQGFIDLLRHKNPRIQKIGQDLVIYSLINGVNQGAKNFIRFIPTQYLVSTGIASKVSSVNLDSLASLNMSESSGDMLEGFIKQYYQNNPKMARKVDRKEVVAVAEGVFKFKSKDIAKNYLVIRGEDQAFIELLSMTNPKSPQGHDLFVYRGEGMYERVPTHGNAYTSVYNSETEDFISPEFEQHRSRIRPKVVKKKTEGPVPSPVKVENPASEKNFAIDNIETVNDLLKHVQETASNQTHKDFAKILRSAVMRFNKDVSFKNLPNSSVGYYNSTLNEVGVNLSANLSNSRHILHEVLHSVADNALRADPKTLNKRQREAVSKIKTLHQHMLTKLREGKLEEHGYKYEDYKTYKENFELFIKNDRAYASGENEKILTGPMKKYYPLLNSFKSKSGKVIPLNSREFVTGLMTNEDFTRMMREVKVAKDKSALDQFINLVKDLLKALTTKDGTSAYDIGVEGIMELITPSPKTETQITQKVKTPEPTRVNDNEFMDSLPESNPEPDGAGVDTVDLGLLLGESKAAQPTQQSGGNEDISFDFTAKEKKFQQVVNHIRNRVRRLNEIVTKNIDNKSLVIKNRKKIQELNEQLDTILKKQMLSDVLSYAENEVAESNKIINAAEIGANELRYMTQQLSDTEKVLSYWELDNGLFSAEELRGDTDGNVSRSVARYQKLKGDISILQERRTKAAQAVLVDMVKRESKGTILEGEVSEKTFSEQSEVSWLSSQLMDSSRIGSDALSILDKWIRTAATRTQKESVELFDGFDEHYAKIVKNPLFKEQGFELFLQENAHGEHTGDLVNPISGRFYQTKDLLYKDAKRRSNKANWKRFWNWKKRNEVVFDPAKLYERGEEGYIRKEDADYKAELIEHVGKQTYKLYLEKMDAKMQEYFFMEEAAEAEFLDGSQEGEIQMLAWEVENSPFTYVKIREGGVSNQVGKKYLSPKGHKYLMQAPKRVLADGTKTLWYDEKFTAIEQDEDLLNFYNYLVDSFAYLHNMLPGYETAGVDVNTLPKLKKSFIEDLFKSGKTVPSMYARLNGSLIDSFTSNESNAQQYGLLSPVDNKSERKIGVGMLKNNIDVKDLSFDLGRVFKAYSMMALNYKYKAQIESQVNLLRSVVSDASAIQTTSDGKTRKTDKNGKDYTTNDPKDLKNLLAQMDYTVEVFYGNRREENSTLKRKKLNLEEKAKEKELLEAVKALEEMHDAGTLDTESFDLQKTKLEAQIEELGSNISGTAAGDTVLKYVQLKSMGWNVPAAIANVWFGFLANMTHAAGRRDYTPKEFLRATGIMMSTSVNFYTMGASDTELAKKINALMVDFDVIKEFNEEAYQETSNSNKRAMGMKRLGAYQVQRNSEYFVQGQAFIAKMLNTKIKDAQGNEISLWDAYDAEGNWDIEKMGENTEWNGDVRNQEHNKAFIDFKMHMDQMIKSIHGNYDPNSPIQAKKTLIGRALLQFRSWMPEGFASRFEGEKKDLLMNRIRKGRWVTLVDLGILDSMNAMMRIAMFKGHTLMEDGTIEKEVDLENMRKNMMDVIQYMSLGILYAAMKASMDDDDDRSKKFLNFALNTIARVQDDLDFFVNPASFETITQNSIPAMSIFGDLMKFGDAWIDYISGEDDEIQTGVYVGESKTFRNTIKLLPGGSSIMRIHSQSAQEYRR